MPSIGLPSGPSFSLISMPSGLFEPTWRSATRCSTISSAIRNGSAIDVQREEAVERRVREAVVAADPFDQVRTDARNRAEEVDDHLRAPVRHVAPRQHVAHERLGHEREIDEHADDPQQLARRLVAAVEQRARHVQVHDDEEERRADRVHVLQQPAVGHFAAQVLDRVERGELTRLVVHGDEDARHDLHDEHQQRQRAEEVPDVEVLRRVVAGELIGDELVDRQSLVEPGAETRPCLR